MNAKEAIEQLKWYFECDDGISAEMVTKKAYQIAIQALSDAKGEINMTEKSDYVVLELEEYNKLNSLSKPKLKYYISTEELLFLSALCKELNAQAINLIGTTVEIISEINYNKFDIKLCKKYYNKVSRFISEVL